MQTTRPTSGYYLSSIWQTIGKQLFGKHLANIWQPFAKHLATVWQTRGESWRIIWQTCSNTFGKHLANIGQGSTAGFRARGSAARLYRNNAWRCSSATAVGGGAAPEQAQALESDA